MAESRLDLHQNSPVCGAIEAGNRYDILQCLPLVDRICSSCMHPDTPALSLSAAFFGAYQLAGSPAREASGDAKVGGRVISQVAECTLLHSVPHNSVAACACVPVAARQGPHPICLARAPT